MIFAVAASAQTPVRRVQMPDRSITFVDGKPVLGLPAGLSRGSALCSPAGETYVAPLGDPAGAARVMDLYSVSTTGEVKHLRRNMPQEFDSFYARDFFAAEHSMVTLLEVGHRDERNPDGPARGVEYFLAVSDHDGDGAKLLPIKSNFHPMKVAMFGSGEMLVLGWDEANLLPVLAALKEDGTIRRFRDFDVPSRDAQAVRRPAVKVEDLQGAAFRPFGGNILLTYPGTTKPIHILRPGGQDDPLSLQIPAGFVLHDVLASNYSFTMIARLQPEPSADKPATGDTPPDPPLRIFEFNAQTGARMREFLFDKVPAAAVTCAANSSLTAIYPQPAAAPDAALSADQSSPKMDSAAQLIVATVRR